MSKKIFITLLIFLLATILRFCALENSPPSMYWDEVSQGYNAYSILKTGRDEHQELLPLARFQAFGDYKAPVYTYLDVPFIALFGKNTLAVRFPSALLGSLSVVLTYFLVLELFFYRKDKQNLALFSSFLLAISPWHIQLSRAAYEGNVATFFTILGIFLFFLGLRKRPIWLVLSVVSFVTAFYAFNAHRVFIPLFVFCLLLLYAKKLFHYRRIVIVSVVVGLILLIPFMVYLKSPESKLRFNEVNIFSELSVIKQSNELIAHDNHSLVSRILHNRRVLFSVLYIQHYFDFFNPVYLFISGDGNPRFSHQNTGQLFLWELPLFILGLYLLIKQKNKTTLLILLWFLLSPVAGATARETPHALRSEMFLPTYQIIEALAFVYILMWFKKQKKIYSLVGYATVVVCVGASLFVFLHDYFVHFPTTYAHEWQYGYKEAVEETEKMKASYDVVAFTESYGRPYIYVAFYSDLLPNDFWGDAKIVRDSFGFYTVQKLGKYEFRKELVDYKDGDRKVLYVGRREEIPESFTVKKIINFLNGDSAFVIAERS